MRRRDPAGRVPARPNQVPGLIESCGLTREEVDRAAWVIDTGGHRWEGAAAVNRVLLEVGGAWALLTLPHRFGPIARLEEFAYSWIVRNRARFHRFGITPECEEPGIDCG